MSYAFTDRARWLYGAHALRGLGAGASASINVGSGIKPGDIKPSDVADAAGVQLPDCSSAAITGNSYVDSTFVKCCQDIKKMTGKSATEKAKGIGQCAARGAATGACMAGGVVTFGISTALAPLCGKLGAAIFDRSMGWSAGQWVGAGIGGGICSAISGGIAGPICAYAAAELVGWIADSLGPLIDDIFNPNAARDRELAARKAAHALMDTVEEQLVQADSAVGDLWSNSIKSIKDAYQGALAMLSATNQAKAQQILGFAPQYDGIAKALVAAGVLASPLSWPIDSQHHTVGDRLRAQRATGDGRGCERTAAGCLNDGYSEVCPFSFSDLYMALYYGQGMDKLTGDTRDRRMAFDKQALFTMQTLASGLLPEMQQAIAVVMSRVAITVAGLKQQQLLEEARTKDDAKLVASAVAAANSADVAADAAKSWSGSVRAAALLKVQNKYEIAKQARAVLTFARPPGAPALSSVYYKKANAAVARSAAAVAQAQHNATVAQVMIGSVVAGGIAGVGYLFLRRS